MELNKKQEEGLKIAVSRYRAHESYTVISGYAGSGKSTLIKFIVEALQIDPSMVAYVSFTGKASEVLRRKGCPNATTAHKLLYYSNKDSNGKFHFRARPSSEIRLKYRLIVVDEVSMLPIDIWNLLLSHKVPVIACGDPGQLPPVSKDADNHVLDNPHIFLDQIMRQAQESEIIRLSMDIREERPISLFKGKEVQVIQEKELVEGMYTWADQILVATNKMRFDINTLMRSMNGFEGGPQKGDKIISLSNHWDIYDTKGESNLINGTIGTLGEFYEETYSYPIGKNRIKVPVYCGSFISEANENYEGLIIDKSYLLTNDTKSLTPKQEYFINKMKNIPTMPPLPIEFNYGYAITVHRAQGSQWDKILVFEENFPFNKEEHKRWLYTAVTRSESRVVLVKK